MSSPTFLMRAIALLLTILFSCQAWADECDQLPKPSVTVKRFEEPFTLNTKYGYKEITHLGSALAHPGNQVLGLTRGKAIARFATNIRFYVDQSGRWECASPQLTVTYGFSPMTVFVAKEFPEGSCAYKEIYTHELRHVKTYLAHLASIEKDLAETLNNRFATGDPWRGPVGQAQTMLQQELNDRWLPYIQREINRGEEAQALIDTPEEYARVTNSCNGEIQKRIH